MDDQKTLQHLLKLEAEAAALVNDAQAEADRRISEGEKQNRARYDEAYAGEVAVLEAAYAKNLDAVNTDYRQQVDAFRESLNAVVLKREAFSSLAEKFLLMNVPSGKDLNNAGIAG